MMDVDTHGMSPEPDGQPDTTAGTGPGEDRDGDSEAIVRQLEKSLPRWDGFGDLGWMSEATQVCSCSPSIMIRACGDRCFLPLCPIFLFLSFCLSLFSFFEFDVRVHDVCYYTYRSDVWKSCWRSRVTRMPRTSCR